MLKLDKLVAKIVTTYATDGKAVFARAKLVAENLSAENTEAEVARLVTIGRIVADYPELADHSVGGWDADYQALTTEPAYKVSKSTIGSLGRAYRLPAEIGGVTDEATVALAYKVITRSGTASALASLRKAAEGQGVELDKAATLTALTGVLKGWRTMAAEAKPVRDTAADDTERTDGVASDLPAIDTANVPESVEVTVRQLQAIGERGWSLTDIRALYAAIDELIPALEAQATKLERVSA
jgi:hypothetical protein